MPSDCWIWVLLKSLALQVVQLIVGWGERVIPFVPSMFIPVNALKEVGGKLGGVGSTDGFPAGLPLDPDKLAIGCLG